LVDFDHADTSQKLEDHASCHDWRDAEFH
jgi:hypothetical protein